MWTMKVEILAAILLFPGVVSAGKDASSAGDSVPPPGGSAGVSPAGSVRIRIRVADKDGAPIAGASAFALDADASRISSEAKTDNAGRADLVIPRRLHRFGAVVDGMILLRLERLGTREVLLVMGPAPRPDDDISAGESLRVKPSGTATRSAVRISVLDPGSRALPGVRITVLDPMTRRVVASGFTDGNGQAEAVLTPNRYWVVFGVEGLRVAGKTERAPNDYVYRLEIATAMEDVAVKVKPRGGDDDEFERPEILARRRFEGGGGANNPLPRVSPTLLDMQTTVWPEYMSLPNGPKDPYIEAARRGLGAAAPDAVVMQGWSHPLREQKLGALCIRSWHCSQSEGPAVCCYKGEPSDPYPREGVAGKCTLRAQCAPRRPTR
jgi:hypothetical protein